MNTKKNSKKTKNTPKQSKKTLKTKQSQQITDKNPLHENFFKDLNKIKCMEDELTKASLKFGKCTETKCRKEKKEIREHVKNSKENTKEYKKLSKNLDLCEIKNFKAKSFK